MIVVEGFDGSGKSALARIIGDVFHWPVVHTGGPTKDERDVLGCLIRSANRMRQQVVQDRITHISEAVYSMLTRPACAARALMSLGDFGPHVAVVYCRPPTRVLIDAMCSSEHQLKEYDSKEHLDHVIANTRQLIAIYDTVIARVELQTRVLRYDRTVDNPRGIALQLLSRFSTFSPLDSENTGEDE